MLHILVKGFQVVGVQELDPLSDVVINLKYEEDYKVEYLDEVIEVEGE